MLLHRLSPYRRTLALTGGALLLPLIVISASQLTYLYREREAQVEREGLSIARQLVDVADARIEAELGALRILASSSTLVGPPWDPGFARMQAALALNPGWRVAILSDAVSRETILSTDQRDARNDPIPLPAQVPVSGIAVGVEHHGPQCPCVTMHAALPTRPDLVLSVFVDPRVFQNQLMQRLPEGMVVGLVDREGEFVSRSVDYEGRVGTPATQFVRDAVQRGGEGIYRGVTYEGFENYTAYATSPLTGWSAHVAIDYRALDTPRLQAIAALLAGSLVALAVAGGIIAYAFSDLVARRREEERLVELQRAEALGQFTSTIIHDFRNLLGVFQGCLHMIARRSDDEEVRQLVQSGLDSLERGTKLTNQLLSFARKDRVEREPVDLGELLPGMSDMLQKALGAGVSMRIDVAPDARWVLANRDQLELAMLNLAVNARDAMDGAGEFSITTGKEGDATVVTVADTGPGIPARLRDRVFEPLYTTKPPGKGTGLGLAQVAGAAARSGGSVRVGDGPAGGACFIITLPVAACEVDQTVTPEAS